MATWRALAVWPYEPRPGSSSTFRTSWDQSLRKLEDEVSRIEGDDVVIGIVAAPSAISFSGALKSRADITYPGAEVSFDLPGRGRVVFHTDAYKSLHANLHAIALGLEALRAVDRHGITSSAEQYAGFTQIGPGGGDADRGAELVRAAGGIPAALKKHHPDHGGNARDLADVQAFRRSGRS